MIFSSIKRLSKLFLLFAFVLAGFFLMVCADAAGKPKTCKVLYFHDADCPNCKKFNKETLPVLRKKYGDRLEFIKRNTDEMHNFETMMAFEARYGLKPGDVPELFTVDGGVQKSKDVGEKFTKLVEKYFSSKEPGKYSEFLDNYFKTGKTGISVAESIRKQYLDKPVKLTVYVFDKPGCSGCDRLKIELKYLRKKYEKNLDIKAFSIKGDQAKIFNEVLCVKYKVPEEHHLATPAIFFGEKAICGEKEFRKSSLTREVVKAINDAGKHPTPEISEADLIRAKQVIVRRYRNLAWGAILLAGLLDGINPCAFVTIIFLLSYLTLRKYKRHEVLLVGVSFSGAVFLTYLLIGLGFLKVADSIQEIPLLKHIIYYGAIALAGIIGILNIIDYFKVRHGSLDDMKLKLSSGLRGKINSVIRKNVKMHYFFIGAAVIGFSVSILELACTGQVYLPTILFIINTQGYELKAVLMLVGYNLAFIVPLLIVFALFWYGIGDKVLTHWLQRFGGGIKLATGILFLALAIFLFFI